MEFDNQKTWNLIKEGRTKGCFQIESQLCKAWCKKIMPDTIEHLSALVSMVRPGALEVFIDDKNVPQHYADRKNGKEEISYQYSALEESLKDTFGLLIYQENAIAIAKDIAGFTLQEADSLRKAIGKKLPEEMAKLEELFINGAIKVNKVNQEEARDIFNMIRKSQRYLFCLAHSVAYAIIGYQTAYLKANYPLQFFCAWLRHAHEKIDPLVEKQELIDDAKLFNITIKTPIISDLKSTFYIKEGNIYVGLGNVKGVGEAQTKKLISVLDGCDWASINYYKFLLNYGTKVNKTALTNLISVGAFDSFGSSRQRMIYEYDLWMKLTDKEIEFLSKQNYESLREALIGLGKVKKDGGGCHTKNRVAEILDLVKILDNPPYILDDTPQWIAQKEKELLGASITFHAVDDCDTNTATCSCKEFISGYNGNIVLGVELTRVNEYTTKKGKSPGQLMAFISGSDGTANLEDILCFPTEYATFQDLLVEGNTVLLHGVRSKTNALIIKSVTQI